MKPARILHCHSTFSLGGKEARAVRLMNAFGDRAEHTILSAVPDALDARDSIDPAISVTFPGDAAPALIGKPGPARYRRLSQYMADFDLVLSYNWGSMDSAAARWMFPKHCPPLIHHEDGFNPDELAKLNWKRNLFRRIALRTAEKLVVPSHTLGQIAARHWGRPDAIRIPNGIAVAQYARLPKEGVIPRFVRNEGDVWVGTIAGLRRIKNLPRLVRAVAAQPANVKLVIVGEGPDRDAIMEQASACGIGNRVLLAGFMAEPHRYVGHFDIFALSSDSEQFPISLVEAMAAGKPVISTDVGDIRHMVAEENRHFLVPPKDEAGFAHALGQLVDDAALRQSLGARNQRVALDQYDETAMIHLYAALYGAACGISLLDEKDGAG
jgi:L-malate glycosyltransferase